MATLSIEKETKNGITKYHFWVNRGEFNSDIINTYDTQEEATKAFEMYKKNYVPPTSETIRREEI